MVEVPSLGRVADVCCVQQQGQRLWLVDAKREKTGSFKNCHHGCFLEKSNGLCFVCVFL